MRGQEFENRLKAQIDFPSPSRVASEIVALARDENIDMGRVAQAVERDPALAAKILRVANSAFFAPRRPSQNLRQALVVIGLNAALTLALSFSLVSTFRALNPQGINYPRFWRRALLAATAARAFGQLAKVPSEEDLFLAGLLQDMGVLAIDRIARDFYSKLPQPANHQALITYERERLPYDHAYYTHLMLKTWNVPPRIYQAIQYSHTPHAISGSTDEGRFLRCLVAGSDLAEMVIETRTPGALASFTRQAAKLTGAREDGVSGVITRVVELIPETEELYETSILPAEEAEALLAEARELLAMRNLQALQKVSALQATARVLLSRTEKIEDASRRDPLTGVLNRGWLDRLLEREFTQAVVFGRDLSIASIDLDRLRLVNEKHGTEVGDAILKECARALQACVRGSDLVGRYAAEEFLVVLPGTELNIAEQVAGRMLEAVRGVRVPTRAGPVGITASIGVVTCNPKVRYPHVTAFVAAADHALYTAKLRGRNCVEAASEPPQANRLSMPRQA
jgi:diguanylate cyclase (GGDEF)-like protein